MVAALDGDERVVFDGAAAGFRLVASPDWSSDGRFIYFYGLDSAQSAGVYAIRAEGGRPRLVVRYDDPTKQAFAGFFTVGDDKLYFSIAEYESDIFVMDVGLR